MLRKCPEVKSRFDVQKILKQLKEEKLRQKGQKDNGGSGQSLPSMENVERIPVSVNGIKFEGVLDSAATHTFVSAAMVGGDV